MFSYTNRTLRWIEFTNARTIACFWRCASRTCNTWSYRGWVGWGEGRGIRQMLIRWCLGHPFLSFYRSLYTLSLPLTPCFSLSLAKSPSYSLCPSFTSYPFRPLIPCFAISLAESLLFSDTKHAILVRLCNRHYYYRPRRPSVCLSDTLIVDFSHGRNIHVR